MRRKFVIWQKKICMRDIFFASCTKICYPERADCRFGWEGRSHGLRQGRERPPETTTARSATLL